MNALRRASYRWEGRSKALKASRIGRNQYLCARCKEVYPKKQVQLDHIECVIPVTGFDSWEGVIERLFSDESNFQCLCKPCHKNKTKLENQLRRKKNP